MWLAVRLSGHLLANFYQISDTVHCWNLQSEQRDRGLYQSQTAVNNSGRLEKSKHNHKPPDQYQISWLAVRAKVSSHYSAPPHTLSASKATNQRFRRLFFNSRNYILYRMSIFVLLKLYCGCNFKANKTFFPGKY